MATSVKLTNNYYLDSSCIYDDELGKLQSTLNKSFTTYYNGDAGACNSRWGGRNLDNVYTPEQLHSKISTGDFSDLGIGDYYTRTVNDVSTNWRIAGADYFWRHGSDCTTHHLVMVPDACVASAAMNDTNTTDGGYVGSKMWTTTIPTIAASIQSAFGSSHVLSHTELLTKTVDTTKSCSGCSWLTGASTDWDWYSVLCNIMSEPMVYGGMVFSSSSLDVGNRHNQLPLFKLAPGMICNRADWWLSSVAGSADFCGVHDGGSASYYSASGVFGVRPYFLFA